MLRGLGGADTNRMKSMALETPHTHTLVEIHVSGDIALGSVDECALSLASEEAVRYLYQHDDSLSFVSKNMLTAPSLSP
jgi:hypothetical protein